MAHFGEITDTLEQTIRDAWSATRALGDCLTGLFFHFYFQDLGIAFNNFFNVSRLIKIQMKHMSKAITQWTGQ